MGHSLNTFGAPVQSYGPAATGFCETNPSVFSPPSSRRGKPVRFRTPPFKNRSNGVINDLSWARLTHPCDVQMCLEVGGMPKWQTANHQ